MTDLIGCTLAEAVIACEHEDLDYEWRRFDHDLCDDQDTLTIYLSEPNYYPATLVYTMNENNVLIDLEIFE